MKNKIISLSIAVSLLMTATIFATSVTSPGSASDPVVSKSYVDTIIGDTLEKILELQKQYNELQLQVETIENVVVNEVSNKDNDNVNTNQNNMDNTNDIEAEYYYTFKPIELSNNQLLLGEEGTELILRSGTAVSYTEVANGLTDITAGVEIMNNEPIPNNHVLIVPRSDNRGISVTANQTWVMIRGKYTIINR